MAQAKLSEFERLELIELFEYLDDLRESGATNMFGAGSWLRDAHGLDSAEASAVLTAWMGTFAADATVEDRVDAAIDAEIAAESASA